MRYPGLAAFCVAALLAAAVAPAVSDPLSAPHYAAGGYFYGADCGGNAVPTAAAGRRAATSGVILAGAGGNAIAAALDCDDRRQALGAYHDGFEGAIGQHYDWRNPNGGSSGSVTPLRQYRRDGQACRDFRAVTIVDQHAAGSRGTACRRQDGNWHTL